MSLTGAYLGYLIGHGYFVALSGGEFVQWKRLESPPSEPEAFLAANPHRIYVKTADGIYFNSDVENCLDHKKTDCWEKVESVDKVQLGYFKCSSGDVASHFQVSIPPIKYNEYLMVNECGGEWYNETHYVRGERGEIWVWQWGSFSMGMIGPFLFIVFGSVILGFVAGLGIAIIMAKFMGRRDIVSR